ncbi:dual oxidase maturation factor 1-like [Argonauta hians]
MFYFHLTNDHGDHHSHLFRAFRGPYGFSYYDSFQSSVKFDKTFAIVVYMCLLFYIAAIFTTLGGRRKARFRHFFELTFNFSVIMVILVCLCGHGWKEGSVNTETTYIDYSDEKMNATIGLTFSLDSVNMTLAGEVGQNSSVYYNERLFLFDADELQEQQKRMFQIGLPSPILKLTNYVCFEGSELMWGRYFRTAGYYAYMLLCATLVFWIITVILMSSVVFYGSVMFLISGITMCSSAVVYSLLQPPIPLQIPFNGQLLELSYGWCFYLLLVTGIIISAVGLFFVILNCIDDRKLGNWLGFEDEEELFFDDLQQRNSTEKSFINNGFTPDISASKSIEEEQQETSLDELNNALNKNNIPHTSVSINTGTSSNQNGQLILHNQMSNMLECDTNKPLDQIAIIDESHRL